MAFQPGSAQHGGNGEVDRGNPFTGVQSAILDEYHRRQYYVGRLVVT